MLGSFPVDFQQQTLARPTLLVTLLLLHLVQCYFVGFGGTPFLFGVYCGLLLAFSKYVRLVGIFANVCGIEKKCPLLHASADLGWLL